MTIGKRVAAAAVILSLSGLTGATIGSSAAMADAGDIVPADSAASARCRFIVDYQGNIVFVECDKIA
jgi:hypothetical protein